MKLCFISPQILGLMELGIGSIAIHKLSTLLFNLLKMYCFTLKIENYAVLKIKYKRRKSLFFQKISIKIIDFPMLIFVGFDII